MKQILAQMLKGLPGVTLDVSRLVESDSILLNVYL
jgi:hypothetical protein